MTRQSDMIQAILKDDHYHLDLFKEQEIATLRERAKRSVELAQHHEEIG